MRRVGVPVTKITVVRNGVPPAPDLSDPVPMLTDCIFRPERV